MKKRITSVLLLSVCFSFTLWGVASQWGDSPQIDAESIFSGIGIDPSNPAEYAFDGDWSTKTQFNSGALQAELIFDFMAPEMLESIELIGEIPAGLDIFVSFDSGGRWVPYYGGIFASTESSTSLLGDLACENVRTSRIRIVFSGASLDSFKLAELLLVSQNTGSHHISPSTIRSSDDASSYASPSNLVDGWTESLWIADGSQAPISSEDALVASILRESDQKRFNHKDWSLPGEGIVEFGFDQPEAISGIYIWFDSQASGVFSVESSILGETQSEHLLYGPGQGWHYVAVGSTDSVDCIRITNMPSSSNLPSGYIGEVVFESDAAPSAYAPAMNVNFDSNPANDYYTFNVPEREYSGSRRYLEIAVSSIENPSVDIQASMNGRDIDFSLSRSSDSVNTYTADIEGFLWEGENYLVIDESSAHPLALRVREEGEYGIFRFPLINDIQPGIGTYNHVFELDGKVLDLDSIELETRDTSWVELLAYNVFSGNWDTLNAVEVENGVHKYGAVSSTDSLRIITDYPESLVSLEVRGRTATGGKPEIEIIQPYEDQIFVRDQIDSLPLVAKVRGSISTASIDGRTQTPYRGVLSEDLLPYCSGRFQSHYLDITDADGELSHIERTFLLLNNAQELEFVNLQSEKLYTRDSQITIDGMIPSGSTLYVNGQAADKVGWYRFSTTLDLEYGVNSFTFELRDDRSGAVLGRVVRYIVRLSTPSVEILYPADGSVVIQSQVAITGKTFGLVDGIVSTGGISTQAIGGEFQLDGIDVNPGPNILTLTASDAYGGMTQKAITFYADFAAPVVTISNPADGEWVSQTLQRISGTYQDDTDTRILINGVPAIVSDGSYYFDLALEEGSNQISVVGIDAAGHRSSPLNLAVNLDTEPPVEFDAELDIQGWSSDNTPTLTFTSEDSGSGIDLYEVSINGGAYFEAVSPFTLPALSDGVQQIDVRAIDHVGWTTTASVTAFIDTVAPLSPLNFYSASGINRNVIGWEAETLDEHTEYVLSRYPEWDSGEKIFNYTNALEPAADEFDPDEPEPFEFRFIDTAENVQDGIDYSYYLVARDRAYNTSTPLSDTAMPNSVEACIPEETDESIEVRFDVLEVSAAVSILPEDIVGISAQSVQEQEYKDILTEASDSDIIGPIFTLAAYVEDDDSGEIVYQPHAAFDEPFQAIVYYDPESLPEGVVEGVLRPYYFNPEFGQWCEVESSYVDAENDRIIFDVDHFSDFSIQATEGTDLTPEEIASTRYSNFRTQIGHEPFVVSTLGGGTNTSFTEFTLPGKGGLDLTIRRTWSSVESTRCMPLWNPYAGGISTPGHSRYGLGFGWRLDLPEVRKARSNMEVVVPGGGIYPIKEMHRINDRLFETTDGSGYVFEISETESKSVQRKSNSRRNGQFLIVSVTITEIVASKLHCPDGTIYDFNEQGLIENISRYDCESKITFNYNSERTDQLELITDTFGRNILFDYEYKTNENKVIESISIEIENDPQGRMVTYNYNPADLTYNQGGLLSSAIDIGGRTWVYDYEKIQKDYGSYKPYYYYLDVVEGPGIGRTDISYTQKKYWSHLQWLWKKKPWWGWFDWYLSSRPRNVHPNEIHIVASNRTVSGGQSDVYTENFDFTYSIPDRNDRHGNDNVFQTSLIINDGRIRRNYYYTIRKVTKYYWYFRDSDHLTGYNTKTNKEYESFESSLTLTDTVTGELIQTTNKEWLLNRNLLSREQTVRPGGLISSETSYSYDARGAITQKISSIQNNDRSYSVVTRTRYLGSSDNADQVYEFGDYGDIEDVVLDEGHYIRNRPLIRTQLKTWSLPDGEDVSQTSVMNYLYNGIGQRTSAATLVDGEWRTQYWTYDPTNGDLATYQNNSGLTTSYAYDYPDSSSGTPQDDAVYSVITTEENVDLSESNPSDIRTKKVFQYYSGLPWWTISPRGFVTVYEYDALGRTVLVSEPSDSDTPIDFVANVSPNSLVADINRSTTVVNYNDDTLTTEVIGPLGNVEIYAFDSLGRLTDLDKTLRDIDEYGHYTGGSHQIETDLVYNQWNEIVSITDPRRNQTGYEYDAMGRLKKVSYPDGEERLIDMDYSTGIETITDERGSNTYVTIDLFGNEIQRVIEIEDGDDIAALTWYDTDGQPVVERQPRRFGNEIRNIDTFHTYNEAGEEIEMVMSEAYMVRSGSEYRAAPVVSMTYDQAGRLVERSLSVGNGADSEVTKYQYNTRDWLLVESILYGTEGEAKTSYVYDSEGNQKEVHYPQERVTLFDYSPRNLMISETLEDPEGDHITTRTYDLVGNIKSLEDPRGNSGNYGVSDFTVTYTYDDLNRLVAGFMPALEQDEDKLLVRLEYDDRGNLKKRIEPNGRTTTYEYDERNRLTEETVKDVDSDIPEISLTTLYHYDEAGNQDRVTYPGDTASHLFAYDEAGRLTSTLTPSLGKREYEYDGASNLVAEIISGPNLIRNQVTHYSYDELNRQVGIVDARNNLTAISYDEAGRMTRRIDPENRVLLNEYDERGLLIKETGYRDQVTRFSYNDAGELVEKYLDIDKSNSVSDGEIRYSYSYNRQGLVGSVVATRNDDSQERTYSYDEAGSLKTVSDGQLNGDVVTTKYNQEGGVYSADPYGLIRRATTSIASELNSITAGTIKYDYDSMQQLINVTSPSNRSVDYGYDGLGRMVTMPGYLADSVSYDDRGLAESLVYGNGIQKDYEWDEDRRLSNLGYQNGLDETYFDWAISYDAAGNIIQRGENTYTYDDLNRLMNASLKDGFSSTESDYLENDSHLETGYVSGDYGGEALLAPVDSELIYSLDYNSASIGANFPSGLLKVTRIILEPSSVDHRVEARNLKIYYKTTATGAFSEWTGWQLLEMEDGRLELRLSRPIEAVAIKVHCLFDERDIAGNPVDVSEFRGLAKDMIRIVYLVPERYETYEYDEVGNRTIEEVEQIATETKSYVYDDPSKTLLLSAGDTRYQYDDYGSLIAMGPVDDFGVPDTQSDEYRSYEYDLFGRMIRVKDRNGERATYSYDFKGMRIAKRKADETIFFYFDEAGRVIETIEESSEGNTATTTAWIGQKPLAMTDGVDTWWYVTDHQGTTLMLTDSDGEIVWEESANPFGISGNDQEENKARMLYTGKVFDPDTQMYYFNARWYDPETGRFASEDPARDGVNWYAYVGNNPLKWVDPTGLSSQNDEDNDKENRWRSFWRRQRENRERRGNTPRDTSGVAESNREVYDRWQNNWTNRQSDAYQREQELRRGLRDSDPGFGDKYDRFLKGDQDALGDAYRNASAELAAANAMVESMAEVLRHVEDQATLGNLVDLEAINDVALGVIKGQQLVQEYVAPLAYAGLALGQMRNKTPIAPADDIQPGATPREGQKVYRVWGQDPANPDSVPKQSGPWGKAWTRVDPRTVNNYRNAAGLPDNANLGRFVSEGRLLDTTGVTSRQALRIGSNAGGLDEVQVRDPINQIALDRVSGVNPNY